MIFHIYNRDKSLEGSAGIAGPPYFGSPTLDQTLLVLDEAGLSIPTLLSVLYNSVLATRYYLMSTLRCPFAFMNAGNE
jgi:hypothetical protein